MNVSGKMKVWIKDFNGIKSYSTGVSNKNKEGQYEKMYISIQLPKDNDINNGDDIEVKKAFISMYKDKNGLAHPKVVIQEFEKVTSTENNISNDFGNDYMYAGDDLPF